jgi:hypothetical protein
MNKPQYIVIHHSLTKDGQTVSWGAIRRYHTHTQGWRDIGYQFGIELVGDYYEVLLGRLVGEEGAHCPGLNSKSIGICCVGNFDQAEPPDRQWQICLNLTRQLMRDYGIEPGRVLGHREWARDGRSCPGKQWDMGLFRTLL